jgi:hypothetical protein
MLIPCLLITFATIILVTFLVELYMYICCSSFDRHGPFSSTAKLQTVFGLDKKHEVDIDDFQRVFASGVSGLEVGLFDIDLGDDAVDEEWTTQMDQARLENAEVATERAKEHAMAMEAAQAVVQDSEAHYHLAYTKHLNQGGNIPQRNRFDLVAKRIFDTCKGGIDGLKVVLLQPDLGVPKDRRTVLVRR